MYSLEGMNRQAISAGIRALRALDAAAVIPADRRKYDPLIRSIEKMIKKENIRRLLTTQWTGDERVRAIIKILSIIQMPGFYVDKRVSYLAGLQNTRHSLKYGLAPETPLGLTASSFRMMYWHDIEKMYEFGRLALELGDKIGISSQRADGRGHYANLILPWKHHLRKSVELNREGLSLAYESGNLPQIGYISSHIITNAFHCGENLEELYARLPAAHKEITKATNVIAFYYFIGIERVLRSLLHGWNDTELFLCDMDEETQGPLYDQPMLHRLFRLLHLHGALLVFIQGV
jgi:predicted ATPase